MGIAFVVARRSVDEDELGMLSNEIGIQKVKRPHLVDRRIVNADQTKRGSPQEACLCRNGEMYRTPPRKRWRGGLPCWLESSVNVLATFEGSFRSGHTRKKTQTGIQSAKMLRQQSAARSSIFQPSFLLSLFVEIPL